MNDLEEGEMGGEGVEKHVVRFMIDLAAMC